MTSYKVGDIIKRAQTKVDKDNADLEYYVGGEHILTDELMVSQKGLIAGSTIGPMFYYGFKPGDFLLVSRNPHLRKSGRVDFSGICSEKTFVLESIDPDILLPDFLPFVFQNERFWSYAERNKHGSTNFFINWSTLANYEFELPAFERQKELSELLWAIDDLRRVYKALILESDNVIKSRFVEMFGSCEYPTTPLSNCVDSIDSGKSPKCNSSPRFDRSPAVLKLSAISSGVYLESENKALLPGESIVRSKEVAAGDILLARKNTPELVGKSVYVGSTEGNIMFPDIVFRMHPLATVDGIYLSCLLSGPLFDSIRALAHGSAKSMSNIPKTKLAKLPVPMPPLTLQQEFAAFVQQVDKLKLATQNALDSLDATSRAILNEELGLENG